MKKSLISILVVVMILSVSLMAFAACVNGENVDVELQIGLTKPTEAGKTPIDSSMDGRTMFQAVVQNYYDAEYVASQLWGRVDTKVGPIETSQMVDAIKIREGKGDANGNNANGATYYLDNISYSQFAALYEKIYVKSDEILYRSANVDYDKKAGIEIKSWNGIKTYADVAAYNDDQCNNPTTLWGYDSSDENVQEVTTPVYNKEEGVYSFTVTLNTDDKTIGAYKKTMAKQLENAGKTAEEISFKSLSITLYVWDNGMVRNMEIKESYKLVVGLSLGLTTMKLNSVVSLISNVQYTYDKNEQGYILSEYIEKFSDDNDKEYSKPYTDLKKEEE